VTIYSPPTAAPYYARCPLAPHACPAARNTVQPRQARNDAPGARAAALPAPPPNRHARRPARPDLPMRGTARP